MWSCPILVEPLHTSIHTSTRPKLPSRTCSAQQCNTSFCDRDSYVVWVFETKRSDYSLFWDGHSSRASHIERGPLKQLVWSFCAPVHTVNAIDMSTEPEACFVAWTKHHQGSQDPHQSCSRTPFTSLNVFSCQLGWVYAWSGFSMGTTDDPFLRFCVTKYMNDQYLGNVFGLTFANSFQQNLSLHPNC